MKKQFAIACSGGVALLAAAGAAQGSCGSAFCVLNTNWSTQGVASEPGAFRLDERFEFVDQKHLQSGTKRISQADDTADTTELRTINRNLLTTLDFSKVGDTRVLGMYRFDDEKNPVVSQGLIFGLKLPTGSYRISNADGAVAERALQPGTGSTDLVLGGYYSAPGIHQDSSWFVQALYQQAVSTKEEYKPGNQFQLNVGYRYPLGHDWQALLQVNSLIKRRDSGANAEPDLSGSKSVFLSPGLIYSLTHDLQLYSFVQLPIYRYYNGTQLSVDWAFVAGATMRF